MIGYQLSGICVDADTKCLKFRVDIYQDTLMILLFVAIYTMKLYKYCTNRE